MARGEPPTPRSTTCISGSAILTFSSRSIACTFSTLVVANLFLCHAPTSLNGVSRCSSAAGSRSKKSAAFTSATSRTHRARVFMIWDRHQVLAFLQQTEWRIARLLWTSSTGPTPWSRIRTLTNTLCMPTRTICGSSTMATTWAQPSQRASRRGSEGSLVMVSPKRSDVPPCRP